MSGVLTKCDILNVRRRKNVRSKESITSCTKCKASDKMSGELRHKVLEMFRLSCRNTNSSNNSKSNGSNNS